MKKFFACVTFLFSSYIAFSQTGVKPTTGTAFVMKNGGTWSFQEYAPNIFKVVFQPKGYATNENISDAVIEKPKAASWKQIFVTKDSSCKIEWENFSVYFKGDTIFLGKDKRAELVSSFQRDGYHGFQFLLHNSEKIFWWWGEGIASGPQGVHV